LLKRLFGCPVRLRQARLQITKGRRPHNKNAVCRKAPSGKVMLSRIVRLVNLTVGAVFPRYDWVV
jgi:hypothetical protein